MKLTFDANNGSLLTTLTIEMFCPINSWAETEDFRKKYPFNPQYNYIPYPTVTGTTPQAPLGVVGYDAAGGLAIKDNTGLLNASFLICRETPYRALMKELITAKVRINMIRLSCSNIPQLTQQISMFSFYPLTGKFAEKNYKVEKSPTDVLPNLLDFKPSPPIIIDKYTGIYFSLLPATILTMYIDFDLLP